MKGATDTSNFDDYPDSDQEPPAVNALGRPEPFQPFQRGWSRHMAVHVLRGRTLLCLSSRTHSGEFVPVQQDES